MKMSTRMNTGPAANVSARRPFGVVGLAVAALLGCCGAAAAAPDRSGGWADVRGQATGFFHVEQIQGVWWLITPEGNGFFSKGVNHISWAGDGAPALGYAPYQRAVEAKYGDAAKWAAAAAGRLRGWGFNTVGAWSGREMFAQSVPYTVILDLAASTGANWQRGEVADVFAPEFAAKLKPVAQQRCAGRQRDPFLLGYFTDNELRWGADWRSRKSLFEEFFARAAEVPGKQVAVRLLRARHPTLADFNQAWGTELKDFNELERLTALPMTNEIAKAVQGDFVREYGRAYFKACQEAIKSADPNHLNLGCRFAGYAPGPVVEAMGEFVDVVSFNNYSFSAPAEQLRTLHRITGRPVMLTEFSFKAKDSGLPNTRGAGQPVATQQDRAEHFERYVTALAQMPFMVGYHWFQYADQPAEGRFDGENSNYGLVNIKDEPWAALTERMTQLNARLEQIHRESAALP